jgi:beta-lactamase regulating signal transducer with metallopeptidase domain
MNLITQLFSERFTHALGWTLLHALWQGTLAALLVALLMVLLHRSSSTIRYFVALTALFTTFCMTVVTFLVLHHRDAPATQAVRTVVNPVMVTPPSAYSPADPIHKLMPRPVAPTFVRYFNQHLPSIVVVWLLGITVLALRLLGGLAYVQRLRHYQAQPLSPVWQQRLRELSRQIRVSRPVRLAESSLVKVPLVIGYFKPLILLPIGTITGMPAIQMEAILAHELAHIRRNDYLVNLFQSAMEILFFYHPAIWWLSGCVREEREHCCDDTAIATCGDSLIYAKALANLEALHLQAPVLAMALTGRSGSLLNRIERFMKQPRRNPSFSEGMVASLVLLAGLLAVTVSAKAGFHFNAPTTAATVPIKAARVERATVTVPPPAESLPSRVAQDTIRQRSEITIVKDKKGRILELYVDGRKIPKEQIGSYREVIEGRTKPMPPPPPTPPVVLSPAPAQSPEIPVASAEVWGVSPAPAPYPAPSSVRGLRRAKAVVPHRTHADGDDAYDEEWEREMEKLAEEMERLTDEMEGLEEELIERPAKESTRVREAIRTLETDIRRQEQKMERLERSREVLTERHAQDMHPHEDARRKHEHDRQKNDKVLQAITQAMKKEGLIGDENNFEFRINRDGLLVNGKKQPPAVYERYKKLIEQETGKPFQEKDQLHSVFKTK